MFLMFLNKINMNKLIIHIETLFFQLLLLPLVSRLVAFNSSFNVLNEFVDGVVDNISDILSSSFLIDSKLSLDCTDFDLEPTNN